MTAPRERYINFYTDFAFFPEFDEEEIAKFTPREAYEYEESLKIYRDWYSISQTAIHKAEEKGREEGRQEGREEGRQEGREEEALRIAKTLKASGLDLKTIAQATNLPLSDIERL